MKMKLSVLLLAGALTACGDTKYEASTVAHVTGGLIEGMQLPGNEVAFKGIPFAAPPSLLAIPS